MQELLLLSPLSHVSDAMAGDSHLPSSPLHLKESLGHVDRLHSSLKAERCKRGPTTSSENWPSPMGADWWLHLKRPAMCWTTFTPWAEMLNNNNKKTTPKPKKLKKWLLMFQNGRSLAVIRIGGLCSGQRVGVGLRAKFGGGPSGQTTTTRSCSYKQLQRKSCFPGLGINGQI